MYHTLKDFKEVIQVLSTSFSFSRILWAFEKFKEFQGPVEPSTYSVNSKCCTLQAYLRRYSAHFAVSLCFKTPTDNFKFKHRTNTAANH